MKALGCLITGLVWMVVIGSAIPWYCWIMGLIAYLIFASAK